MITQQQLDAFVGKPIGEICGNAYSSPQDDHCAHFVSHVIGFDFGRTCRMMMGTAKAPGASLQIQDVFAKCRRVGVWSLRPAMLKTCLVFLTKSTNVNLSSKTMAKVPRQHVGVYMNGQIWHYSNRQQKVVRQTAAQFGQQHSAPDNAMFFGTLR
jgi:hypothetical protein